MKENITIIASYYSKPPVKEVSSKEQFIREFQEVDISSAILSWKKWLYFIIREALGVWAINSIPKDITLIVYSKKYIRRIIHVQIAGRDNSFNHFLEIECVNCNLYNKTLTK